MAKAKEIKTRMAPHNLEAEQAILGCVFLSSEAAIEIFSKLFGADFYAETHKIIFDAMKKVFERNQPVDFVTLTDELDMQDKLDAIGGTNYLTTLSNVVPSASNFRAYLEIVKKFSILRALISSCDKIIEKAYESGEQDALEFAEGLIFGLAESGRTSDLEQIEKSLDEVIERFETIHKDNTALQGLATGFWGIDDITNGLQKSDLIFIAARPGIGKTSLAMNIATNVAISKKSKVAVFSLEMSKVQLTQRMLCSVANVDMAKALKGELKTGDWAKFWTATKKLKGTSIFIDDSSLNTPAAIMSKCRKIKREKGLDLIVIDYLQLMSGDSKRIENRQQEISEISRKLKILAKEMNTPVIVLSQLSRAVENRTSHRPVLSDLRESGAIEQDADMVMFIHKKDMYAQAQGAVIDTENMDVEVIIAKHRNGKLGSVFLTWKGATVSFTNQSKDSNLQSIMKSAPQPKQSGEKIPEEVEKEVKDIFGDNQ